MHISRSTVIVHHPWLLLASARKLTQERALFMPTASGPRSLALCRDDYYVYTDTSEYSAHFRRQASARIQHDSRHVQLYLHAHATISAQGCQSASELLQWPSTRRHGTPSKQSLPSMRVSASILVPKGFNLHSRTQPRCWSTFANDVPHSWEVGWAMWWALNPLKHI